MLKSAGSERVNSGTKRQNKEKGPWLLCLEVTRSQFLGRKSVNSDTKRERERKKKTPSTLPDGHVKGCAKQLAVLGSTKRENKEKGPLAAQSEKTKKKDPGVLYLMVMSKDALSS